ncbi:MAG TPA: hypothetical protein VKT29_13765 [Terriglobales bacterium]|nr:hypothetical protein [Terriglobales bacterium]
MWAWQRGRFLLIPLVVMAVLHLAGWAVAESRKGWLINSGEAARGRILAGVQVFDLAENIVLVYISWVLLRVLV